MGGRGFVRLGKSRGEERGGEGEVGSLGMGWDA